MLDFKKLSNMPFEEAEKLVFADGYKQDSEAKSNCASGDAEMVLDSYYKKFDEDKESTISFVQLYNVIKHNEGDLDDDIEVIKSYWEEVQQ